MKELSDRQKNILTLVIHEYIRSAEPVGSRLIVENYRLDLSSATVRNELAELTEQGYLRQPHTSAGRVPTEEGYRYFVGRLMRDTNLPEDTRRTISHQFYQMPNDIHQWMKLAASVLASQTKGASLVTAPHTHQARFKHLELVSTHGRQILAVMVVDGGDIHQTLLTLEEPVSQEQLSGIAAKFNQLCQGNDFKAISEISGAFSAAELLTFNWIVETLTHADTMLSGEVYLDGITNVLSEPEFADSGEARRALHVLEERSMLQDLLSRTVLTTNTSTNGVQVLIGGEGTWDELRDCSIILARYGSPEQATGTLGVLGPMRMSYGRSISVVRFISTLLSDLVAEQW
jgi:heat-inducible transcriptional repressor